MRKELLAKGAVIVALAAPVLPMTVAAIDAVETHDRTTNALQSLEIDEYNMRARLQGSGLSEREREGLLERQTSLEGYRQGVKNRAKADYKDNATLAAAGAATESLVVASLLMFRRRAQKAARSQSSQA